MSFTLLEMTQEILSALDSDEVNSISDTVESYQVATLIRAVYFDCATDIGLPEHETLFELDASGDANKPTLMTIPDDIARVHWIKYDNKEDADTYKNYLEATFLPFQDFFSRQKSLIDQSSNVGQMSFVMNSETFEVMYRSDKMPQFYTVIDDTTVLFDSFDNTIDTTLQKSKTMAFGSKYPTFTLTDSFTPRLDESQFSYLRNKAKVRAFNELKQVINQEAVGETRRQKIIIQKLQRRSPDVSPIEKLPRYGKASRGYGRLSKQQLQGN